MRRPRAWAACYVYRPRGCWSREDECNIDDDEHETHKIDDDEHEQQQKRRYVDDERIPLLSVMTPGPGDPEVAYAKQETAPPPPTGTRFSPWLIHVIPAFDLFFCLRRPTKEKLTATTISSAIVFKTVEGRFECSIRRLFICIEM